MTSNVQSAFKQYEVLESESKRLHLDVDLRRRDHEAIVAELARKVEASRVGRAMLLSKTTELEGKMAELAKAKTVVLEWEEQFNHTKRSHDNAVARKNQESAKAAEIARRAQMGIDDYRAITNSLTKSDGGKITKICLIQAAQAKLGELRQLREKKEEEEHQLACAAERVVQKGRN